jgi:cob(I)alamin adenosyltransferase
MRLTKIFTKTGDDGTTSANGKDRVGKDSTLISAIGDIDELNSFIGLLDIPIKTSVQNNLFNIGGQLSMMNSTKLLMDDTEIEKLEQDIEQINQHLPPLTNFVLPSGMVHVARAVCRRAERSIVALGVTDVTKVPIQYLNRLSDYLFVYARKETFKGETLWDQPRKNM